MIELPIERQNAKISRISDIATAKFFQGSIEDQKPNFVITRFGESVSRSRLVATVMEKFFSEDQRFASITIDDGSGGIRVRVFADDSKKLEDVDVGDLVSVVGKIKNYNGENYIAPDFVRKLEDPNSELLFKLEVLENLFEKKKVVDDLKNLRDQMSDEELSEYASEKYGLDKETLQVILQSEVEKIDYKPAILDLIGELDRGEGVEIGKLLEASKLDESMAESAINELLASGELYEPVAGKLRKVPA